MLPSILSVWLLQIFRTSTVLAHNNLEQAVVALEPQLSSGAIVTFPWEPRWDTLQGRASYPRLSPNYSVVVEVATEQDVQTTVSLANRFNIPFLAVSGTHGWTTSLNRFPYGIQINMRKLNTTTISPDGKTAVAGGGTLQHEITHSLFAHGKYAVTGLCECTSLAGPLLGGGHSLLQGQHGFALDNLVSAHVVIASGKLVEASKTQNPDLFWALKGAGHNYGILTSLEVNVYDVQSNWTVYSLVFASDKLEGLFDLINKFEEPSSGRPANLALTGVFAKIPAIDPTHPVIAYNIIYKGSRANAEPYATQFSALGPISTTVYTDVDGGQLYTVLGNGIESQVCVRNHNIAGVGSSLPAWDVEGARKAFTIFSNLTMDTRFSNSVILLENYGMQGVRAVDPALSALALEERERPVLASPVLWWEGNDEETTRDANAYLHALREALYTGLDKKNGTRHTYMNYAMGDEDNAELYGYDDRLERLAKLKQKWDPKNRFAFYNPIV